jgi:hypothetical protein
VSGWQGGGQGHVGGGAVGLGRGSEGGGGGLLGLRIRWPSSPRGLGGVGRRRRWWGSGHRGGGAGTVVAGDTEPPNPRVGAPPVLRR